MAGDARNIDAQLVQKLLDGDVKAFDALYHRYSKRLYGFSFGMLKSREDAEGVVQETFSRILENRENLRPDMSFSWYLFTIARNLILNMLHHHTYEIKYQQQTIAEAEIEENHTEEIIFYQDMEGHRGKAY